MKRMLLILVVAVVLFGASAGVSVFMQKAPPKEGETTSEKDKGTKGLLSRSEKIEEEEKKAPELPNKSILKPSAESLAQLAASLRQKEELIHAKEQKLVTRQGQLNLIFNDMKTEQKAIEDLRKEIASEMALLTTKMDELERKATDLDRKKTKLSEHASEVKKAVFEVDAVEQNRIKQIGAMYNSMDAEVAAEVFQQMADSGKLDTAVKILANMQDRQAARVLAAIPDRATVVLMVEKLKGLKKTTSP